MGPTYPEDDPWGLFPANVAGLDIRHPDDMQNAVDLCKVHIKNGDHYAAGAVIALRCVFAALALVPSEKISATAVVHAYAQFGDFLISREMAISDDRTRLNLGYMNAVKWEALRQCAKEYLPEAERDAYEFVFVAAYPVAAKRPAKFM